MVKEQRVAQAEMDVQHERSSLAETVCSVLEVAEMNRTL
jgi:hypothetical protein